MACIVLKLICGFKAKCPVVLLSCLPFVFVLGGSSTGKVFFPHTLSEIFKGRSGNLYRNFYTRCPLFEVVLVAEEFKFLNKFNDQSCIPLKN